MESTLANKGLRTISLYNGTVLSLTEYEFSAMMAIVYAPESRGEAAAGRSNSGSIKANSADALHEGRCSTT